MSRCARRSATRTRSSPTAPRSPGTRPPHRWRFTKANGRTRPITQFGEVAVPNQSGHIYLVTNRHGQYRLITLARPAISGEMYGIITTLLAGRGSLLTPIAAPIAYLPIKMVASPSFGRISTDDANYTPYRRLCGGRPRNPSPCSFRDSARHGLHSSRNSSISAPIRITALPC